MLGHLWYTVQPCDCQCWASLSCVLITFMCFHLTCWACCKALSLIAHNQTAVKVVGKAQATKSNSHNFWYRCLVLALIDVSEVLAQTLHDCMTYERRENLKFV